MYENPIIRVQKSEIAISAFSLIVFYSRDLLYKNSSMNIWKKTGKQKMHSGENLSSYKWAWQIFITERQHKKVLDRIIPEKLRSYLNEK